MSDWPTEPLVHITAGEVDEYPIRNALAKHEPHYSDEHPETYVIATGPQAGEPVVQGVEGDSIAEWYPVTIIPTEVIDKLHAAFYDINMTEQQSEAFRALETHLF